MVSTGMEKSESMLRWCVWVDNCGHYFDDINEAHEFAQACLDSGYDAVVIEAIEDNRTIN